MPSADNSAGHACFYAPPPWPGPGGLLTLPAEEARHATRSRRLGAGARITLVDGEGRRGRAVLEPTGGRALGARLEHCAADPLEGAPGWVMLLPWLRSAARLDWAIEKGTELGCRAFCVFAAGHSMKAGPRRIEARVTRWRAVARSAMKQAGRSWWPPVEVAADLAAALARLPGGPLLLGEVGGAAVPLAAGEGAVGLVVGPEGGWAAEERELLVQREARPVGLGAFRLRSETAAVALAAWVASRAPRSGAAAGEV
jgi:16S rRNA (uracil1498-N3)-methyltransferase